MAPQEDISRTLDVQRFAEARKAEILSLEASTKEYGTQWGIKALPRHLRRRATSHNSYVHKRRPNLKLQQARAAAKATGEAGTPCNRAMRRRKARLQQCIVQDMAAGPNATGSRRARMLETHVWHAKRMQMATRWGHKLAQGASGKGHGSRAFLHTLRHGATIHDASYWLALQLTGSHAGLTSLLASLCGEEALGATMARSETMEGPWEAELVLHHPHSFPQGAITPVKVLYQSGSGHTAQPMEGSRSVADRQQQSRLLLSVHAAAHEEALHAISLAAAASDVALHPRYDLQRVELKGALSDRAVAAALRLAEERGEPSLPAVPGSQISSRLFGLLQATGGATASELPSNAVLRVQVQDPRIAKHSKPLAGVTGSSPSSSPQLSDYREEMKEARGLSKQLSAEGASALLWGKDSVPQPLSEAAVSGHRQQQKLAGLLLPGNPPEPLPMEHSSCPILMARQAPKDRQAVPSWALTVPSGWVSPIWQALAYQGARPAGQRERRWTAMQQNEAFFPHDYPDTLAYAQLAAELAAEQDAHSSLRPKGRCSEGTPHPPPWNLLGTSVLITADSSVSPIEAATPAAPEEEAVEATSPSVGQPDIHVSAAAGEAQTAEPGESGVLDSPPEDEPTAMDTDGLAHCHSSGDARGRSGHAVFQHGSALAPIFVARSQHAVQRCLHCNTQAQPGDQPSLQRASMVDPEAGIRPEGRAGHEGSSEAGVRCMVRVSLQTVGPGVLHAGSAILSLSAEEAVTIKRSMLGHKLHSKDMPQEDRQEVKSFKVALREFQHRQHTLQSPDSQQTTGMASEEPQSVSAQEAAAGQLVSRRALIGFVTGEAPRGLVGRGACGVCLGASLDALSMQQSQGKGGAGVLVAYRSPLSSVLRLAEARTVW